MIQCRHDISKHEDAPCPACVERAAILALIEDTAKSWKDSGDPHQVVEVILARIRARS